MQCRKCGCTLNPEEAMKGTICMACAQRILDTTPKYVLILEAAFNALVRDFVENNIIPQWNIDEAHKRADELAKELGLELTEPDEFAQKLGLDE